jgi:hypothetical protein
MTNATEQRKLAAIMFTDMVGYSALSQRDDKLALELLEEHRQLLREIFPHFHGTEIKTIGDAFLVEFNSALEAAQCAIEIQRTLAKRNADAPADGQIELKIGIQFRWREFLKSRLHCIANLAFHIHGNANPACARQWFNTRGDVDSITVDIACAMHYVANMDSKRSRLPTTSRGQGTDRA